MNNQQDVLSQSYTDSISSELHRRMMADEANDDTASKYHTSHSIKSSPSYTMPNTKSMIDDYNYKRRGSNYTDGGASSYYDPLAEEEGNLYSDNESLDEDKITPLPKVQMFVIAIILFSEPLTSTILFPFIYFMVNYLAKQNMG